MRRNQASRHVHGVLLKILLGVMLVAGGCGSEVRAQPQIGSRDDCRNTAAVADVTVSTTAIEVVTANARLCGATVLNRSTADAIRCRSQRDGDPTSTLGTVLGPGGVLELKIDAQVGWSCVRDATATGDVVVNRTYSLP